LSRVPFPAAMITIAIRGLIELLGLCFDLRIGFTINRGRFEGWRRVPIWDTLFTVFNVT
jgi:hypothetical protein